MTEERVVTIKAAEKAVTVKRDSRDSSDGNGRDRGVGRSPEVVRQRKLRMRSSRILRAHAQ